MDTTIAALVAGLIVALLGAAIRLVRAVTRWLEIRIFASAERSRRRNLKRSRRESSGLLLPSGRPAHEAAPENIDEETTDTYELVELEREQQRERERVRRERHRGGTRPPRRGTHHD